VPRKVMRMRERVLDHVWESGSTGARVVRMLLTPLGWGYGAAVTLRNFAYDRGWSAAHPLALPTIAVGNLTVGGTGKTPVSAWLAAALRSRGARPAIVLRGYGGDEALVHRRLNPDIPVIADPDRVRGVATAGAEGATVAVLDDGFQHRRARRDVDVVLLSADRFGPFRFLPAGPWREPLSSLTRASVIVVTRKSASPLRARDLLSQAMRFAPEAEGAVVLFAVGPLVACEADIVREAATLTGARVLAISAIGDARAFESQLRTLGAQVEGAAFPDHHAFSAGDVASLARRVQGATIPVCTLKDAVKLAPLWPRQAPPLWYLSQRVSVEVGAEALDGLVARFASRGAP
jgi:tetraacyldisaccharide 4'-kinase